MLKLRLISAVFLIVSAVYAMTISQSTIPALIFVMGIIGLSGMEFIALRWHSIEGHSRVESHRPKMTSETLIVGGLYGITIPMIVLIDRVTGGHARMTNISFFTWISIMTTVGAIFFYVRSNQIEISTQKLLNSLSGVCYLIIPGLCIFELSQIDLPASPRGVGAYFCLAIVSMGDTFAYFGGRFFGKRKMLPLVSPKKTWEGSFCGLVASGLTAILFTKLFSLPFSESIALIIGLISGVCGQIGDLFESAIKRSAACKDSGNLLPGHGGFLDRIDGILFASPVVYLLMEFFIGP